MKAFILFLTVCFGLTIYSQNGESYVSNEIVVGFKESVITYYDNKTDVIKDIEVDHFFKSQNVGNVRKLKRSSIKSAKEFVLRFNTEVDLQQLVKRFELTGWFDYVELNYKGIAASGPCEVVPNDADYNKQWGLNNDGTFNSESVAGIDINAQRAWYLSQGSSSVIVAIIDSGAKLNHSEFSGRIWHNTADDEGPGTGNGVDNDGNGYIDDRVGWDFVSSDNDPSDFPGHGTNIAGVIGANGNNSNEYAGIDWNCELMILRGLGNTLGGNSADWSEAIYYAVDNGADVINMSLGIGSNSTALSNAVDYAYNNNVVIVASMMNTNNSTVHYPAAYANTIAVGAIDSDGQRVEPFDNVASINSAGSCYGAHIDVCAPGNWIWGLKPNGFAPSYWSGTSQAAPHVTGVVSLMKAVDNTLTFNAVRNILHTTSIDQVGNSTEDVSGFDNYHGHGKVDAYEALHFIIGDVVTASTETICDNETFTFNGQSLGPNDGGAHTYSSCDSVFNLTLNVSSSYTSSSDVTLCNGQTHSFGGQTYTSSDAGIHTQTLVATNTCDSIVSINIISLNGGSFNDAVTICSGETYQFGSQLLTSSDAGSHTEVFQASSGCDSTVVLSFSVDSPQSSNVTETICQGSTYQFGSQLLTSNDSGSHTEVFQSVNGCDSTVALNLVVEAPITNSISQSICQGSTYQFGSQLLTSNDVGSHTEVFQSSNGCDSTVSLNLIVETPITSSFNQSVCQGGSYQFGSQVLTSNDAGSHTAVFQTVNGCDSTVTLNLTAEAPITSSFSQSVCQGSSYQFGSQTLTSNDAGTHTEVFQTVNGCDSSVTLTLTAEAPITSSFSQSICQGDTYQFGSQVLTSNNAGANTEVFQTVNGCDSTVTLSLVVLSPQNSNSNVVICDGETYQFGSQLLNSSNPGVYSEVFQNANGCDSTVSLTLSVNGSPNSSSTSESICQGDVFEFGDQMISQTGTYTEIFQNVSGCDSVVTLSMSVNVTPFVTINQLGEDLSCSFGQGYQWSLDGNVISGAINQTYMPLVDGTYSVEIIANNGCVGYAEYEMIGVSIYENNKNQNNIIVFPNPANDVVDIKLKKPSSIYIYNSVGELVISDLLMLKNRTIKIGDLSKGIYYIVSGKDIEKLIII